jgi:hypothetical protein
VAGAGRVRPIAGGGWLVSDPDDDATRILDQRLRIAATVPGPHDNVAADAQHIAVIDEDALAVSDMHGRLLWQRAVAYGSECHVDGRGVLWILVGDLLEAVDVTTGRCPGHARLGATHGWSDWIDDPLNGWTGLHLNHGNGTCHSWLARPTTDCGIQVTAATGPTVTAFHRTEPRYLAMSHQTDRLTVRDIATDTVLADRSCDTLADPDARPLTAVIVSNSLTLAAFNLDDDTTDLELHLLLCAATLQPRSTVAYPHPAHQRDVHRSTESGVWLTRTDQSLCLWQLDGLLDDDPIPGQQTLF